MVDGGGRGGDGRDSCSFHAAYTTFEADVTHMTDQIRPEGVKLLFTSLVVVLSLFRVSAESVVLEPSRGRSKDVGSSVGGAEGEPVCLSGSGSKEK